MSDHDTYPSCAGVPFVTVVAVHVAVSSGLGLEAALAAHGLDLDRWMDADEAYADHLTAAVETDGDLLDRHDRLFMRLRDALGTVEAPAAGSAAAFFALLREVGTAPDPAQALAAHGLSPHELAALGRRWTEGLGDDPLAAIVAADAYVNGTVEPGPARRRGPVIVLEGGAEDGEQRRDEAGEAAVIPLHEGAAPAAGRARRRR